MSEKQISGKDVLKRIAPVGIAVVLIVLIAIIVTSVKGCTNKTPKIEKGNEVYLTLGDYEITNERLYTYLKQQYGVSELLRLVDEKIYETKKAEILAKADSTDFDNLTDLDKFIMTSVFEKELTQEEATYSENVEKWETLITSLEMNNLTKKALTDEDKKIEKLDSHVWEIVREFYALQYARREWAKETFKKEFTDEEIEDYFEENYSNSVQAIFVPFTSELAAKKAMASVGINTNDDVLNEKGWVKASYDYVGNSDEKIPADEFLSPKEVVEAIAALYNLVYNNVELGENQKEITSEMLETVFDAQKTLSKVVTALEEAIKNVTSAEGDIVLPSKVVVKEAGVEKEAVVAWEIESGEGFTLVENKLQHNNTTSDDALKTVVKATITYNEKTSSKSFDFEAIKVDAKALEETVVVSEVEAFETYKFNTEKTGDIKVEWNTEELTAINSSLATLLKVDSSTCTISDDPSEFYKSYTVKPTSCGEYYVVAIKLVKEIVEYDFEAEKENIKAKLTEEALTDNEITKLIYENRNNAKFAIYDKYLEAIYDYQYTNFYETTLKLTDYAKYKDTKKNQSKVVAKFEVNGKKQEITADELFKELKDKYAVSASIDLINQYRIVSDEKFNTVYNPYKNKIDEKAYKELLETEIGGFRKNFELDYFTYSYLSYYGFTPNFPAKYGWNDFKKDYFGAFTDEELLINASFGGSVYTDALTKYTESFYEAADVKAAMQKAYDEWYGLNVVNIFAYVDTNLDGSPDTQTNKDGGEFKTTNWTAEQKALVDELMDKVFELAPTTGKTTIHEQLTEIVTNYKNAGFEDGGYGDSIYTYNYWAKYKKAGIMLKLEAATNYDITSSLVEEFLGELETMYKDLTEKGYEGTLEVPYVSGCVETTYGFHKIIALGVTDKPVLPTDEEIAIHELLEDAAANANSTVAYKKEIYDNAVKELKEKYDIEYTSEYKMDETVTERLEAWYEEAVSEVSGTVVLSKDLANYLTKEKANIKVEDKASYDTILDIIIKESMKDAE